MKNKNNIKDFLTKHSMAIILIIFFIVIFVLTILSSRGYFTTSGMTYEQMKELAQQYQPQH